MLQMIAGIHFQKHTDTGTLAEFLQLKIGVNAMLTIKIDLQVLLTNDF